jgi:ubiquinone/menaquinone biosynthesis C-methylase UbiE
VNTVNNRDSVSTANSAQEATWNGYEGEHWAQHDERWNAVNAALTPGDRVLDIGCGAGQTSRLAAHAVTAGEATGSVLGLDLSAPELAQARRRAEAEGLSAHLSFERADAQTTALPPGSFDVALSRFGIMFFADPVAAFANIHAALRPASGRLALLTMAEATSCGWVHALTATGPHLPLPNFTSGVPGMFSLADPDEFRRFLGAAGYHDIAFERIEAPMRFGDDAEDAAAFILDSGPGRYLLSLVTPTAAAAAREALTEAMRHYESAADGVQLPGAAWLATARAAAG